VTLVSAQGTSNIIVNGRPIAEDIILTIARGMVNPGRTTSRSPQASRCSC